MASHQQATLAAYSVALLAVLASGLACNSGLLDSLLDATVPDEARFGRPFAKPAPVAKSFVNWESPHVAPLALTPDGSRLLAVNTAANQLEVFDVTGAAPLLTDSVAVGLDPVSVRARNEREAWVVNHVSDSISVIDLERGVVVRTLLPGDEPTDVAFARDRAFVVCSQINRVFVYELQDLDAPPVELEVVGEDPRMAVASPDGSLVFVTIFESGNNTTIIPAPLVSDPDGPYGGQNPPPNLRGEIAPPLSADLPTPPRLSLIVKRDAETGMWLDDNGADWSSFVTWDFVDHDIAVIDSSALTISYVSGLMNLDMSLAATKSALLVVGTESLNHVRYEPNLTGRFVRSALATVATPALIATRIADLNPQVQRDTGGSFTPLAAELRRESLADPRAIAVSQDASQTYIAGMGSNNVAKLSAGGERLATVDVGAGPTGLALDENRARLYVLNRFDATISMIDTVNFSELGRSSFFDPTPAAIRAGRPFLYDARRTSGLGLTACASCHIDGRMDQLAWDLGNPAGSMKPFNQECESLTSALPSVCDDFHPLKGPMTTQTLQGIVGAEPLHWRGDRESLAAFNPAFVGLLGNDRQLSDAEMADFEAFVATLTFPPNPNRNADGSLRTDVFGANAAHGEALYMSDAIDTPQAIAVRNPDDPLAPLFSALGGLFSCNRCHQLPLGTNHRISSARSLGTEQGTKIPQLRNMHEKTGMRKDGQTGTRGFGFTHNGEFATVDDFLHRRNFHFGDGALGDQNRADIIAFVMSLSEDTHAGVGLQATLGGAAAATALADERVALMLRLADAGEVGLVVNARLNGVRRGLAYVGDQLFQTDRAAERIDTATLRAAASADSPQTWTLVPFGSQKRIGIDRDSDGVLNGDE